MKKSILSFVGGAIFGLMTLSLSSCGNGDNALEQIVNSDPVVAFTLQKVLETNSVFVVKFKLNNENCSVTIKNTGDGFVIQSCEGVDPDLFKFGLTGDKKLLVLTKLVEAEGDDAEFQMFFNPQDNSFYIIDGLREVGVDPTEFDGKVSVNGIEGTLTDECPDKATIQLWRDKIVDGPCRAGTRSLAIVPGIFDPTVCEDDHEFEEDNNELIIRYKNGETWQKVVNRFSISKFVDILCAEDEKVFVFIKERVSTYDDGVYELRYDNVQKVLPGHKVGVKDVEDYFGEAYGEAFTRDYPAIGSVICYE